MALNTVLPDGLYDLGSQGYHTYPPGSTLWSPRVDSYPQQDMPPHPRLSEARDIPGERPPEVPDHATGKTCELSNVRQHWGSLVVKAFPRMYY